MRRATTSPEVARPNHSPCGTTYLTSTESGATCHGPMDPYLNALLGSAGRSRTRARIVAHTLRYIHPSLGEPWFCVRIVLRASSGGPRPAPETFPVFRLPALFRWCRHRSNSVQVKTGRWTGTLTLPTHRSRTTPAGYVVRRGSRLERGGRIRHALGHALGTRTLGARTLGTPSKPRTSLEMQVAIARCCGIDDLNAAAPCACPESVPRVRAPSVCLECARPKCSECGPRASDPCLSVRQKRFLTPR